VTAEQTVGRAESNVELAREQKQPLQGRRRLVYAFTYINLSLQALALALALYSLGVHELGWRLLAACLVVAGLLLVFLPTVATTVRVYGERLLVRQDPAPSETPSPTALFQPCRRAHAVSRPAVAMGTSWQGRAWR
jgi:hypothetical protein